MIEYILIGAFVLMLSVLLSLTSEEHFGKELILHILCIGVLVAFAMTVSFDKGYKDGQSDALKGEYQYEMKVESDTTFIKK